MVVCIKSIEFGLNIHVELKSASTLSTEKERDTLVIWISNNLGFSSPFLYRAIIIED